MSSHGVLIVKSPVKIEKDIRVFDEFQLKAVDNISIIKGLSHFNQPSNLIFMK
jgi:hypothetical protein